MEEIKLYDKYWLPRVKAVERTVANAFAKRIRRGMRNLKNKERGAYVVDTTPAVSFEAPSVE